MKHKIILVVIILIFLFLGGVILFFYKNTKNLSLNSDIKIGKDIYISVSKDVSIDSDYITNVIKEETDSDFELLDKDGLKELEKYLSENDYEIEEGLYVINQAWSFEQYKDILKYRKIDNR